MPDPSSVATFFTTHAALRAEKLLQTADIPGKLIPTPRHLSADCTLALEFPSALQDRVREILDRHAVETSGMYCLE
ncbi:MAG: DUF3343 domain-containing protein [Pirellulales bacterium]|nr:DUF3343 domain-containing protein [Pirellulales bacterium]